MVNRIEKRCNEHKQSRMEPMNTIKDIFTIIFNFKRVNPFIRTGRWLIFVGTGLCLNDPIRQVIILLDYHTIRLDFNLKLIDNQEWYFLIIGISLIVSGLIMIFREQNRTDPQITVKKKVLFYLCGLPIQSKMTPQFFRDKFLEINEIVIADEDKNTMLYNYIHYKSRVQDWINQIGNEEIYFAGLARVPFLYLFGALFRSTNFVIKLFDFIHETNTWSLLDQESANPNLSFVGKDKIPKQCDNIGILIEFSSSIASMEVKGIVGENIIRIGVKNKPKFNAFRNLDDLNKVVSKTNQLIIDYSKRAANIHLFMAVQSSFAFLLGTKYQEGVIGKIYIHNFDGNRYNWAIKLSNGNTDLTQGEDYTS